MLGINVNFRSSIVGKSFFTDMTGKTRSAMVDINVNIRSPRVGA